MHLETTTINNETNKQHNYTQITRDNLCLLCKICVQISVWQINYTLTWLVKYGLNCRLVGVGDDRFELFLLPTDTEPETEYELSESVPELIRLVVEVVFLPPGVSEKREAELLDDVDILDGTR